MFLQTDDVCVFDSTLSKEYLLVALAFNLTYGDIMDLSRSGIASIFGGESEKRRLLEIIRAFETAQLNGTD